MKKNVMIVILCISVSIVFLINIDLVVSEGKIRPTIEIGEISKVSASSNNCTSCNVAGGKGASSCECENSSIFGGTHCSVSTKDHYFACCRTDGWGNCHCFPCNPYTMEETDWIAD